MPEIQFEITTAEERSRRRKEGCCGLFLIIVGILCYDFFCNRQPQIQQHHRVEWQEEIIQPPPNLPSSQEDVAKLYCNASREHGCADQLDHLVGCSITSFSKGELLCQTETMTVTISLTPSNL